MTAASATHEGAQRTGDWQALAVFGGGADRLDAALEGAVAPVIQAARGDGRLTQWHFTRWVDQRGAHLRLALAGPGIGRVAEEIGRGLLPALEGDHAPREEVMPPPASHRRGGRHVGVEWAEHRPESERFGPALAEAEDLFEVSSELVLETLPALPRGRERVAYGLSLMLVLSELGLEAQAQPAFWDDVTVRWTGSDERGRRVLDRLTGHAQRLAPELVPEARRLREQGRTAAGLGRYAEACRTMLASAHDLPPTDLVRQHAHLTNNRLGVNPLEEILLASILALGLAGRPTAAAATGPGEEAVDEQAGEALRLEEVSKREGGRQVLEDVSVTVCAGEVFGLLGPEGAGKSSLLGVAAGMRVVSEGTVRVLGADPAADRHELAGDLGVALPEEELAASRSVRENLELRARAEGATADQVLETIGLRDRSAIAVRDLGPGERRRVALGCGLMSRPRVVFLDEPTADLSAVEREEVWEVVRHVRDEEGITVILATTSVQEMRSVCDRAALIFAGQLVDVGAPDDLADHHFSLRELHFRTVDEPDVALLQDLPEVAGVEVEQRADHFSLTVTTMQPDELLRLLGNDPDFPSIASVALEDLEATFLTHARGSDDDEG